MTSAVSEVMPTGMFASMAGSTATAGTASQDKDMFLQLLVAQLRFQDPMNPTDSAQFLTQTAQFTALEKMQDVATQVALMVSTQMAFGASNLVGRSVSYLNAEGATVAGTVQGVNFGAEGPILDVDGVPVALAAVQSVTNAAAETDGASTADSPVDNPSV